MYPVHSESRDDLSLVDDKNNKFIRKGEATMAATTAINGQLTDIKTPKKRGRRKKTERERNIRRMIEDKLDSIRLEKYTSDYWFDE